MATKKDIRAYKKNGIQYSYILDCISSDYVELTTDKEKVMYFFSQFEIEHNSEYYKRAIPNEQARIADYLQGLPSCCSVDYWCDDIAKIGKSWGLCQTPKKELAFVEDWYNVLALRLIQLREYFNK